MICASCGTMNDPGFKFCSNCGTALTRVCPSCDTANDPAFNFCSNCGTGLSGDATVAIEASPVADPGERRFVSVLFADLVGFTPFAESHDPEEVRAMLTRYFERASEIVERFGGEVDKFIGDAVTAFWGAHVAQEDDAERAVRAALELVDAVAELGEEIGVPDLELRAGVLSGETSVGSGGNETGLVVGDIVNTASRLQSIAESGSVFVGESTKELTAGSIHYAEVGEHDLKGKSAPVVVWRAVEIVAERGGRGRSGGLEPPFVGRENELRLLKDQLHAAGHEQRARLVSIVGEGGIGKSRLIWELTKYVDGLADTFLWHQGRSPAYGDGVTFWALGEMVRQRARIAETDDPMKARTKLRTAVAEWVPSEDEKRWIEPRLAGLLGLDEMPAGDRTELFAALRTFFQRLTESNTVVLIFEDAHWADDGLLEFIAELIDRSQRHPILVVTLARPSLLDGHPDWGSSRRGFMSVHLGPLADVDMAALVSGMVPGIPEDTVALVVDHAAGVPLYAVEYVRMLIASGDLVTEGDGYRQTTAVESLSLPDSLQAVVAARIDHMDAGDRTVIQDAAVLGQSFTIDGLTLLGDRSEEELVPILERLVRAEILEVDDDPRSPERGQYHFVQSVIREVTYGRLSKQERRNRHVAVADHYERIGGIDEFAVVVASHYLAAYEAGADETLAVAARTALTQAAKRAADLHSHRQALSLVEHALEVPGDDASRVPLWELGAVSASYLFEHERSVALAVEAHEWQRDHGSDRGLVRATAVLGSVLMAAERPVEGAAAMAPAFEAGRAREREMMRLGAELSRAYMLASDLQRSADVARDTLIAAEAEGAMEIVVETMNTRGTSLSGLGRFHESFALLREAMRLGAEHDLVQAELRALNNFRVVNAVNGPLAGAEIDWRMLEVAKRVGQMDFIVRAAGSCSYQLVLEGRWDEATAMLGDLDLPAGNTWEVTFRAVTLLWQWAVSGNKSYLAEARDVLNQNLGGEEPQLEAWTLDELAELHLFEADNQRAYDEALAIPVEGRLPENHLWATPTLAAMRLRDADRLDAALDDWGGERVVGKRFEVIHLANRAGRAALDRRDDEAVSLFRRALSLSESTDGALWTSFLRAVYAELMPHRSEAQAAGREAYEWFSSVGAQGYLDLFSDVWPLVLEESAAG